MLIENTIKRFRFGFESFQRAPLFSRCHREGHIARDCPEADDLYNYAKPESRNGPTAQEDTDEEDYANNGESAEADSHVNAEAEQEEEEEEEAEKEGEPEQEAA